jgi:hypothetical protein
MTDETAETKVSDPIYDYWIKELDAEAKAHKDFRKEGDRVYERYRNEKEKKGAFNILWSNTRVQHSAVLSSRPKPDVTRRYKDPDQLSRDIAEITERALSYSVDVYDFDSNSNLAVDDFLLPGMGQVRIRYTPYFGPGEPPRVPVAPQPDGTFQHEGQEVTPQIDELGQPFILGEPPEVVVYEEVSCEVVPWKRFRWQPANTWENVNWCAIEHYLKKEELKAQFGEEKADLCPLGYSEEGTKGDDQQDGKNRAKVYEIFDKRKREVIFICEGFNQPLGKESDPLQLQGFYPFPKPMMTNVLADKCIPKADFLFYEEQADELDRVSIRIRELTKQLKWNGLYDGAFKQLADLDKAGDGDFLPVDDWSSRFMGGSVPSLESAIIFRPIDKLISVISGLYQEREQIKQTIYEITGISDIIRGSTDSSETLGAQQLKQQNASLGLTPKENEVSRFYRDVYRLKAEVIVEQFQPQTLTLMTGIQVTPEMLAIMKNDLLRSYKIDIETDSTVAADQAEEQSNAVELMSAITSFTQQALPLIQAGVPVEIIKELLLFVVRRFKNGDQLEQVLEKLGDSAQPGGMIGSPGNPAMGPVAPPM